MTSHIYIESINIYSYIWVCEKYIFLTFLSIFSIYEDVHVNVNSLYIKFLYNFFLPDISSAAIASFTFISLLQSVDLMVVEDDDANKV